MPTVLLVVVAALNGCMDLEANLTAAGNGCFKSSLDLEV